MKKHEQRKNTNEILDALGGLYERICENDFSDGDRLRMRRMIGALADEIQAVQVGINMKDILNKPEDSPAGMDSSPAEAEAEPVATCAMPPIGDGPFHTDCRMLDDDVDSEPNRWDHQDCVNVGFMATATQNDYTKEYLIDQPYPRSATQPRTTEPHMKLHHCDPEEFRKEYRPVLTWADFDRFTGHQVALDRVNIVVLQLNDYLSSLVVFHNEAAKLDHKIRELAAELQKVADGEVF